MGPQMLSFEDTGCQRKNILSVFRILGPKYEKSYVNVSRFESIEFSRKTLYQFVINIFGIHLNQ